MSPKASMACATKTDLNEYIYKQHYNLLTMLEFIKSLFGLSSNDLSPEDLRNGTIVDVRTPAEFQQGHADGSINIPLQELGGSLLKIRQMKEPIITCCRSGNRSGMATRQLNGEGIEAINGGTWQNVQGQLEK